MYKILLAIITISISLSQGELFTKGEFKALYTPSSSVSTRISNNAIQKYPFSVVVFTANDNKSVSMINDETDYSNKKISYTSFSKSMIQALIQKGGKPNTYVFLVKDSKGVEHVALSNGDAFLQTGAKCPPVCD